jgi:hypothetical protein
MTTVRAFARSGFRVAPFVDGRRDAALAVSFQENPALNPDNTTQSSGPDELRFAVAARLFPIAFRLEEAWDDAHLGREFALRMVDAVVRFLERQGELPHAFDCPDFAEALLRTFWKRNARRDAARHSAAVERGALPTLVSWESVGDGAAVVGLYDSLRDDPNAGETGRLVADFLQRHGWPRHLAWAFVWRESGNDWDAVTDLVEHRFSRPVSVGALRKWGARNFDRVRPLLRAYLGGSDEPIAGLN